MTAQPSTAASGRAVFVAGLMIALLLVANVLFCSHRHDTGPSARHVTAVVAASQGHSCVPAPSHEDRHQSAATLKLAPRDRLNLDSAEFVAAVVCVVARPGGPAQPPVVTALSPDPELSQLGVLRV
jgi:hypothetical protein